jgi:hypothetical protein
MQHKTTGDYDAMTTRVVADGITRSVWYGTSLSRLPHLAVLIHDIQPPRFEQNVGGGDATPVK